MGLQAYQQATARAENPREAEYRLFGQVTRALMSAAEADAADMHTRMDALDWNRRLWTALASDCSAPENTLPVPVRAQIISLSLWVSKYSRTVTREKAPLDPLFEINRNIMQGLQAS